MDNQMLINAICGKGFSSMDIACHYEKIGLARFSGNQWNESWEWNRIELEKLDIEKLKDIYNEI